MARTILKVASKSSAADGITCDAHNRVYTTDYEENAIRRFDGARREKQAGETVVQDERLLWPDALWIRDGNLYITTNQLHRMPNLHNGQDLRQRPYVIFRYPLDD